MDATVGQKEEEEGEEEKVGGNPFKDCDLPPLPMATKRGLVWWRDWRPDGLQGEVEQEQGLLMNSWRYLSAFPKYTLLAVRYEMGSRLF